MGERSKNPSCTPEKLPVEVEHTQEPLESRLVWRRREGGVGGGVLGQRRATDGGEKMSNKFNVRDHKFTFVRLEIAS